MINLKNDYSEGAHPLVLESIVHATFEQNDGNGYDIHCTNAANELMRQIHNENADIHFFLGGTAVNKTVISSILKPWQAVICANTGHINVHETGAIESTGHKVLAAKSRDGKVTPEGIRQVVLEHTDEHMVKPAMVYISNSTEIGSIYKKQELEEIRKVCDEYQLYLYLDGARLSNALACEKNDITLEDIAKLTDIFYLGGTKNGALAAEACVILNEALKPQFRYAIKQNGAMASKGFLLGLQFEALLKDKLYLALAKHANEMAQKLVEVIKKYHYPFLSTPMTNQIFPIVPNEIYEKLKNEVLFEVWGKKDSEHTIVRFVTSWATKAEQIEAFDKIFMEIHGGNEK